MINQICRAYTRIPVKKSSLGFHMIPYHIQYECRDFNTKHEDKLTVEKEINRKEYIKNFNPYLRSNVSENLDQSIVDFYRKKFRN